MTSAGDSPTPATKPIWKRPIAWIGGILGLCVVCTICTYAVSGILLDRAGQAAQDTFEDMDSSVQATLEAQMDEEFQFEEGTDPAKDQSSTDSPGDDPSAGETSGSDTASGEPELSDIGALVGGEEGEYLFFMIEVFVDFTTSFAEFAAVQVKAKQDESILNNPETRATLEEQFATLRSAAERVKEVEKVPDNRADLHNQFIELSDSIIEFSNTYEGKLGEFDSQQLSDLLHRSREIQQQVNELNLQLMEGQQ